MKRRVDFSSFPAEFSVSPRRYITYYITPAKSALHNVGLFLFVLQMKTRSIDHHFWTHCVCLTDGVYLQCSGWKSVVRLGDGLCLNPVWYGRVRTLFTVASHCVTPQATTFFLKGCRGAYLGVLTVSFVAQACALSPSIQRNRERSRPLFAEQSSAPLLFSFISNAALSVETALKPLTRVCEGSQTLAQGQKTQTWLFARWMWAPVLLSLTVCHIHWTAFFFVSYAEPVRVFWSAYGIFFSSFTNPGTSIERTVILCFVSLYI